MKRVEVNPGEMFAVSDKVILVREYESVLGMVGKLKTTDNDRVAYMFTFAGKLNNRNASADCTVMMSPEDAFELASDILNGLSLLTGAEQ